MIAIDTHFTVALVPFAGSCQVYGFNGRVMGVVEGA